MFKYLCLKSQFRRSHRQKGVRHTPTPPWNPNRLTANPSFGDRVKPLIHIFEGFGQVPVTYEGGVVFVHPQWMDFMISWLWSWELLVSKPMGIFGGVSRSDPATHSGWYPGSCVCKKWYEQIVFYQTNTGVFLNFVPSSSPGSVVILNLKASLEYEFGPSQAENTLW
jgi:hypothetical protein